MNIFFLEPPEAILYLSWCKNVRTVAGNAGGYVIQ